MELYAAVRRSVYVVEGLSERAAARRFGLARETVRKMLRYRLPPGYRRAQPIRRPKLDAFTGVIDQILREDQSRPKKQRHTAKRIGERLCAEYGFTGGDTIVKAYVRAQRLGGQEMFVPLAHPPGDAQADFGEALVVIAGVECKAHYLVVDLPHSDDGFVKAFPAETTEAFCDGHNAAFTYFGGVPRRIVYDNTKLAVARILGDGTRQRTQVFSELQSHYLFDARFGRPGKGNDKGKVEGLVGYARRNFFVPIPRVGSWDALNADLERQCNARRGRRLRRHTETIGERFARDREALLPLPPVPYDACDTRTTRVTSLSLVRYRRNDYSVPTAYGHREVLVKGSVDDVVIVCGSDEIARHRRSYGREELIFNPRHYLALLERTTGALDQAAPLAGWALPEEFLRLRRAAITQLLTAPANGMTPRGRPCNRRSACSSNTLAKRAGVTTGMAIADARRRCPGIALVPQQPDLYTRIHHRIVAAVLDVLPIDAVCSIDEFAATVEPRDIPAVLTHQIKQRLRDAVGAHITCSIGYAPNRWLAKIAADLDKPDGLTVLQPRELPGRLLTLDLEDVPGVATRMRTRLARWGLTSVEDLWQADPLQLRAAWGSVTGARLWYALHGYAVAPPRGVGARIPPPR